MCLASHNELLSRFTEICKRPGDRRQRNGRSQESAELAWKHNYDIVLRADELAPEAEAEFGWHPNDIHPYIAKGMICICSTRLNHRFPV